MHEMNALNYLNYNPAAILKKHVCITHVIMYLSCCITLMGMLGQSSLAKLKVYKYMQNDMKSTLLLFYTYMKLSDANHNLMRAKIFSSHF